MRFLVITLLFGLAVAGSAFYAKVGLRGSVEEELKFLAEEVLKKEGYDGVEVVFDHLNGSLSGSVDQPADIPVVLALLASQVPGAHWDPKAGESLTIRPTLPPRIRVVRAASGQGVKVEGTLSSLDEAGREMLGTRLQSVPGVSQVDNAITFDPMILSFPEMAEFVSLTSGLLAHGGAVDVTLAEGVLRPAGEVPNDGLKESLLQIAGRMEGISVDDAIVVKPVVVYTRDAELKVTRNRFGVTLTGVLSAAADREKVESIVREAGISGGLSNRIEVSAECGPAAWQDRLADLLPPLLSQSQGEMTVEFGRTRVRLSGTVGTAETRDGLVARFAPLGQGEGSVKIESNLLVSTGSASESQVRLTATLTEDLLVLAGELPESDWVAELESRIKESKPKLSIKNELKRVESGPGDAWTRGLADFFAEALPRLGIAELQWGKGELRLEGRTVELPDRQILQNLAVNLLPQDYKVHNLLLHADQPFPKPALLPEQRTKLAEILKSNPIYFDKASDVLRDDDRSKVTAIFNAIKESGAEVALEITGFADNVGNADRNEELSLSRAGNVKAELVRLGLGEAQLGLATKTVDVSNVSRSELWKARRVEVSLKPVPTPPAP